MRIIFILTFCAFCLSTVAQRNHAIKNRYAKGTILFTNGNILDCEIAFPILNRSSSLGPTIRSKNKLTIKNMSDEKEKIDIDEIQTIQFEGEGGFYTMSVMHSITLRRKNKKKLSKHKAWFIHEINCDGLHSYVKADKFDIDKEGQPYAIHVNNMGEYLLQREGEEWPTLISTAITYNGANKKQFWKIRRNSFAQYMGDDEHAQNFLADKKRLTAKELEDYIAERCK